MALDDYGSLIASGQQLVPDLTKQLLQQAQTAALRAQASEVQQKQARMSALQQALSQSDGSPTAISRLMIAFPEFADSLKKGYDVQDQAARDADLTSSAELYSAANSGNWALAGKLAHRRADAEKASGLNDPNYDSALQTMDAAVAGDKNAQRIVLNTLGMHIAAATGAEHFGTVYNAMKPDLMTVAPGADVIDKNNPQAGSVYSSPYRPQLWTDPTTGQTFQLVPNGSAKPGGAASPSGGGFDNAVSFTMGHEGGYNPSDRNGAPVNFGINQKANPDVDVKNLTADQAKQLYLDRYWKPSGAENLPPAMQTPYFDTYVLNPKEAKSILKASDGNPMKFIQLRRAWLKTLEKSGKYDQAWTARTDALEQQLHSSGASYYGNAAPTQTATVGGKTYYKINGQWFDNPEGK
jgi:hypothetical protein